MLAVHLSAASTLAYLRPAFARPRFWLGLALWAAGFLGNVAHDEILLNIRRKARAKGKHTARDGEHYSIPTGLLYRYISYPNYFCEWIEWSGFALAASTSPDFPLLLTALTRAPAARSFTALATLFAPFADSVSPEWAFVLSEVLLMLPRAVRGHRWYLDRFGESYPHERRVVIPFLL